MRRAMTAGAERRPAVAALILAAAALCALLLALPGETVTTVYVNDLLIFLDGAHRVMAGQTPSRDFHTALGPLTFYIPAAGYWLSGTLGGALPTGMALCLLALAPAIAHVVTSRLHAVVGVPFAAFVILIIAVPMNLGESVARLSFAMFYNRIGWAALAVLLVMYLPPRQARPGQEGLDAGAAAFLTLVMLYTKITYGLVALAFLAFLLLDPRQRRWAAAAILATLVAGLLVEAVWRSSLTHLADLRLAGQVSGTRSLEGFALGFLGHLADYVMFALLVGLALHRTRSFRDLLFYGFCAGPGLLVMVQNSQPWGIIMLHGGAVVAAETLVRPKQDTQRPGAGGRLGPGVRLAAGAPLALLALLLPTVIHCAIALGLHATLAASRAGEPFGMPQFDRVRLALLWSPGDHDFSTRYLASLRDGAQALAGLDPPPSRVSVLDFASPFSAGLGLAPPRGDSAWLHWGRNVNAAHFLPAAQLFADVSVLMVPKWGVNNVPLTDLYGTQIRASFEPVRETEFWTVYSRRGDHR